MLARPARQSVHPPAPKPAKPFRHLGPIEPATSNAASAWPATIGPVTAGLDHSKSLPQGAPANTTIRLEKVSAPYLQPEPAADDAGPARTLLQTHANCARLALRGLARPCAGRENTPAKPCNDYGFHHDAVTFAFSTARSASPLSGLHRRVSRLVSAATA